MPITITSTTDTGEQVTQALQERKTAADAETETEQEAEAEAEPESGDGAQDTGADADADAESEGEDGGDEDESEDEGGEATPKRRRKEDAEGRIAQLTRDRDQFRDRARDREEENQRLREENERLRGGRSTDDDNTAAKAKPKTFDKPRPKLEDFDTLEEWQDATVDWSTEKAQFYTDQRLEERLAANNQQNDQQTAQQRLMATHVERVKAYSAAHPEFAEAARKAQEDQLPIHDIVMQHILHTELGPHLLHYLADHPDEARELHKMAAGPALTRIGKIEGRIEDRLEAEKKNKTGKTATTDTDQSRTGLNRATAQSPKPKTKVEPPIRPVGGSNTKTTQRLDELPYDEYKKVRQGGRRQ